MPRIGDLVLGVVTDTRKAIQQLGTFRKHLGRSTKQMRSAAGSVAKLGASFGVLGGVIGGAGFAAGFSKAAKAIDDIAKNSARIGITTEAFQGLAHTARIFGSDQEQVTKALQKQQRAVSEANVGLMTQKRAFTDLGLSIESLRDNSADQIFFKVATAIKGVKFETDQMRIATDIYGRAGREMINMLKSADPELRKLSQEARVLGAAFSAEEALKVEKFNDEVERLKLLAGGQFNKFVIDVSDEAVSVVKGLQAWVIEASKLAKIVVKKVVGSDNKEDATAKRLGYSTKLQLDLAIARGDVNPSQLIQDRFKESRTSMFQERAKNVNTTRNAAAAAGRGILGTITGAAAGSGLNRQNVGKLADAAKAFEDKLRLATIRETTIGRSQREKARVDIERARQEKMREEMATKRDALAGRIAGEFTNQTTADRKRAMSPLAERGTSEAFNAIRRSLVPAGAKKSIEEISKQILTEDQESNALQREILEVLKNQVEIPA